MSAIDHCLENNARYAAGLAPGSLAAPPSMRIAVVTCMDARIEVAAVLGLEIGEAHVIRNAGGVVTEDVIRSLTISQRLLGTREIMVIGHTRCGMLSEEAARLGDEIARVGEPPPFEIGAFSELDGEIRRSLDAITASPFVEHTGEARGFVYDVDTGALREVARD
jgi:carbonic anhydrase